MSTKTYKIYLIKNEVDNKYYIGMTKQALQTRFLAHYNSCTNEELYNDMHRLGKEQFTYTALEKNIETQEEARDLEQQYILQWKQNYLLYNKNLSGYNHHFICIETNEEFTSIQDACNKYNITKKDLYHALYNNSSNNLSNTIINDNKSLHWKSLIQKNKNPAYYVYLISQLINNQWIPIYVGQTGKTLQTRFTQHVRGPSAIYKVLNSMPLNNFKIEALYSQLSKEDANRLERQETINYSKKYKLYNKNIETLHITKPNREGKTYINLKKLNDKSLLANKETILKNNHYSIYLLEYKGKNEALVVTNYSIQFINEAITEEDNADELIKFLNKIDIRYGTFNIIKDNIGTYEEAINWKNQYIQEHEMSDLSIDNNIFYQAINKRELKGRPIIDQAKSDSLKKAWARPETREKHLAATGFKQAIRCIDTGEVFESLAEVCRVYDIAKNSLFRNVTGNAKHALSRKLNQQLHFEYIDQEHTNNSMIQQDTYSVFEILCKHVPCGIVFTNSNQRDILLRYKNRKSVIGDYMKQEGYDNFSLRLIQNNVMSRDQAAQIKRQKYDELATQGYKLLTQRG